MAAKRRTPARARKPTPAPGPEPTPDAPRAAPAWRRTIWLADAAQSERGANNFDVLRLAAAVFVVFGHCFFVLQEEAPILDAGAFVDWGNLGVLMFFAISGFLVSRSWTFDPRVLAFAVKRFLRIWPALAVSLVLTAFVLGPFVTNLDTAEYLQNPDTKLYVLGNLVMWTQQLLPGAFASNPFTNVNIPLWTLAPEVKAYVLVALLGAIGLYRRWWTVVIVALFFASLTITELRNALPFGDRSAAMIQNLQIDAEGVRAAERGEFFAYTQVFAAFWIAAALFALRRWVPLRWDLFLGALVLIGVGAAISEQTGATAFTWLVPYLVLVLAYRTHELWSLPSRFGDYSYGLYIMAFPVQQAVVYWADPGSGWVVLFIALPIALGLAVLSWRYVEAPALTLKGRIIPALDAAATDVGKRPDEREELRTVRGAEAGAERAG
jgi:peptidoglycan/LPS O-acetylase OafA/YrhL